jgi:hypothetical protein
MRSNLQPRPLSNSEVVEVRLLASACCLRGRQRMEHLWNVMKKGLLAGDTLR